MRVLLMHRDRDFQVDRESSPGESALRQDLELDTILEAMSAGDELLLAAATTALLHPLTAPEEIRYRQDVLADCVANPEAVRGMYDLSVGALQVERRVAFGGYRYHGASADTILRGASTMLAELVRALERLRAVADEHVGAFRSEGFRRFFAMLRSDLDDAFFAEVKQHLDRVEFRGGVLISAELGPGHRGTGYVLRRPNPERRSLRQRFGLARDRSSYTFQIPDRDVAGAEALSGLRAAGIGLVANALAQSRDHVASFFATLRAELAFYLACLNLRDRLLANGAPVCVPEPTPGDGAGLSARGLYDPSLSLRLGAPAVGNDVDASGKSLVMLTGANEGGKSTLLRALGVAHLMMQSGMPVGAEAFEAGVRSGVFTHFRREEDAAMDHGKLDGELARMSEIADRIRPGALLLCNESFASTNEPEGSEIARQIVRAMLDRSIRVLFVTHLFDLADGFSREGRDDALFLRAERLPGGRRTFKLFPGAPLPTSYGQDLYARIFEGAG